SIFLLINLVCFYIIVLVVVFVMLLLKIIDTISPGLAIFMSFILFGMIFSTAVSMFYAFTARFVEMRTTKSNLFVSITVIIGFIASFVGFTDLIAFFYPLIGY